MADSAATATGAIASASSAALIASASSVLNAAASASASAAAVIAKANEATEQPPIFKVVGILLAVVSGAFIGTSFVFKKKGLLSSQKKAGTVAGEGHAYLKSPMWWTGMTLMIVGEICNFVAYAFAPALLVTPLGALSVVICAVLSHFFLNETLTFFGKLGCLLCLLGSTIIALNGPAEGSVSTILAFQALFLAPGFLVFGSVVILASLGLVFFVAPKFGKTNMLVYIAVCSLIGGLSVSCTQGLGSSIITSIRGENQFKHWFIYFLLGFVIITLLVEINYLNKALELFNTSMVTPTYYTTFTAATLITSVILYQGLHASAIAIVTVVFGFIVTCTGITILQMSKVDPTELKLDRRSTILLSASKQDVDNEKGLGAEDPGIDALRGGFGAIGSIYRARSARHSVQQLARRRSQATSVRNSSGHMPHSSADYELKRHTLYDHPMPSDAQEQIQTYSPSIRTPTGPPPDPATPTAAPRHIGFSNDVVEHRYGTGSAPPGTAQHFEHHNVDGPSRLRFGGGPIPGQGLPANPRALRVDTAPMSDLGTATIISPSHRPYADPYSRSYNSGDGGAALASLNGKMTNFSSDSPNLHLDDPRQRDPRAAHPGRKSSLGGTVTELFSPRRRAEAIADPEETEGLTTRQSRDDDDDGPDSQYALQHGHRNDSRDTFDSRGSVDSLT